MTFLSNAASEPVFSACSYTADIYYKVVCVCGRECMCVRVFSRVYMLLFFTTLHYDAILSMMRRPQLNLSLLCFRKRLKFMYFIL